MLLDDYDIIIPKVLASPLRGGGGFVKRQQKKKKRTLSSNCESLVAGTTITSGGVGPGLMRLPMTGFSHAYRTTTNRNNNKNHPVGLIKVVSDATHLFQHWSQCYDECIEPNACLYIYKNYFTGIFEIPYFIPVV